MKKIVYTAFLTLIGISVIAQPVDPITGFRDMYWGYSLDEAMEDMSLTLEYQNGKIKTFISPTDSHEIGTVKLNEIYYFFHDDAGFFKITLSGNASNNEEMDAILKNRLGKKYERILNPTHSHLMWEIGDVTADYRQQRSEDFSLTLRSEAIADYKREMNDVITDF